MQATKVLLNDIKIALQDYFSNRGTYHDRDLHAQLCVLNSRVNRELSQTQELLNCRYDELDAVTNALSSVTEEDIEAKAFYQSRKEQLVVLTNELSDMLDAIKDNMKTQYVELTEEEFQVFAKAVEWNAKTAKNVPSFQNVKI